MGRRNQRQRQKGLWVAAADLPHTAAHPFYHRLNRLLDEHGFDDFAEQRCAKFYAPRMGRPSLTPGSYFRCLLIGYFEGIDGERGIAWRLADSISLRRFLAIELDESTPDHSTISRTRRLIDVETHREVFTWVLQLLAKQGLLKAGTIAVDATTLEANAALTLDRAARQRRELRRVSQGAGGGVGDRDAEPRAAGQAGQKAQGGYPVDSGSPNILWFGNLLGFMSWVDDHLVIRGVRGYRCRTKR